MLFVGLALFALSSLLVLLPQDGDIIEAALSRANIDRSSLAHRLLVAGKRGTPDPCASPSSHLANWMGCLRDDIRQRPLTWIAMPGSHNSFAYAFLPYNASSKAKVFAPDLPGETINMLELFGAFQGQAYVRDVIGNWSLTQDLNFVQQLEAGVRYFDVRIGFNSDSGQLHFLHGLWGEPALPVLERFATEFLPKHPGEVVLLDFNHLHAMQLAHHRQLADFLLKTFGSKLVPRRQWLSAANLTLAKLREHGQQVVVFYHDIWVVRHASKNVFWPEGTIPSHWPDTTELAKMFDVLDDVVRSHEIDADNSNRSTFLVYQAVLTPTPSTIIFNLGNAKASLSSVLASEATSKFVNEWLPKVIKHHATNSSLPVSATNKMAESKKNNKNKNKQQTQPARNQTTLNDDYGNDLRNGTHFYLGTFNVFIADFIQVGNFSRAIVDLNNI